MEKKMSEKQDLPLIVDHNPEELMKIVEELAETNRRLLNRENELHQKQRYREIYNRVVTTLISSRALGEALKAVVKMICEATDSKIGVIYLYSPNEEELVPFAVNNLEEPLPTFQKGEGLLGSVIKKRQRIVTEDIPDNFPFRIKKAQDLDVSPRTILIQPLQSAGQIMGLLLTGSLKNYRNAALDLVERLSVQIAEAILKALTLQKTVNMARELKFKSEALKKKYVELERAHQVKSAFLAGVSHELKTPLNAIIGFSRVLLNERHGPLNQKQEEYTRYILKNGEHLLSVINDILDLSRIESGTVKMAMQDTNITMVLEECVRSLQSLVESKGQEIRIICGDSIPGIKADRNKIKQILFNLLSNAIKFSPKESCIEIHARLTKYGDEIQISVTDEGHGIPWDHREKIFEPFVRVSGVSAQEGTGLGLALAKKLVEMHGGRIWLEPSTGKGSTFSFTLPVFGFIPQPDRDGIVKVRFDDYE